MSRGRPREFDEAKVLTQATKLFWQKGYRAVSIDDVTDATGVAKPSIYAAFGDKEALFLHSVDHYRDTVIAPVYNELLNSEKLADGLRKFFRTVGSRVTQKDTPGCLIACVMPQASAESPLIKARLAEVIARSDDAFAKVLKQHASQLRAGVDPIDGGKFIVSAIHGMSIRARSGAHVRDLEPIAEFVIKATCK